MSNLSNQTDLPTDAYTMKTSAAVPRKPSVDTDQKKTLGIAAAALLLGGTAWVVRKEIIERNEKSKLVESEQPVKSDVLAEADSSTVNVINNSYSVQNGSDMSPEADLTTANHPEKIDVAGKVTDTMSFEQAFAAARNEVGVEGLFRWHGRWYNTFEKEEWSSLSLEQRQDFAERITGEKLPVRAYHAPVAETGDETAQPAPEPTAIEGHLNGQRVIGLDYDHDGVIDVLVMEGEDGNTFRVVDETGNDGLDTVYRYDALDGELTGAVRLDHPFVLSNDDFSQALEESMSKEVVDSILESDTTSTALLTSAETDDEEEDVDDDDKPQDSDDDDTYTNDGDVQDMDA